MTVFPRAAWASLRRGLAEDADVVLEVVNGITFLTPLWLRRPRVALVHHIHRDHYVAEMGRPGAVAALLAETLPLRLLYRDTTFLTISESGRHDLTELGMPEDRIHVAYLGVEPPPFEASPRSEAPRLLYLGRLKQYKRVELLLDVLEAVPDAVLDIAGEGDHREALEAEIARRGLTERVVLHGHVSEEVKAELLSRSWVNLTASSAEGWCLTVMEAAMYRTPSAALAVGGLPESIEDGRTGLLAEDGEQLTEQVRALVEDRALRERLGETARDRASGFTWERTARENLAVLEHEASAERAGLRASLRGSETLKAAGLAAATLASNALALLFTVLFARLLGADGYGSLAALISTFLILAVPGSALQVVVAREVATGTLGTGARLASTLTAWRRAMLIALVAVSACSLLLREPLADLLAVDQSWAAAATLATGCLWLLLSIERGALQGVHAYREVGWSIVLEAGGRLVSGLLLVALGLGRDRRLPRHADLHGRDRARADRDRAPADRRGRRGPRRDAAARPGLGRLAGRDRPVPRRGAPERRRDPRQAHDRRRGGGRLRRRRGGREGGRVGGDRGRALPAARGDAQGGRGRGPAAGAGARARRRGGGRGADADRLRGRAEAAAARSRSARRPSRPRARCSCSGSR